MTTYVLRNGELVEKEKAGPRPGQAPAVHGDFADGVKCMLDDKMYTSKRHYRDTVRAHGCQIVGNDWNNAPLTHTPTVKGPSPADSIRRAISILS